MAEPIETHSNTFFQKESYEEIPIGYRPIIITDCFSTPSNLGSIIRLAANIGADKVIAISENDLRTSKIRKTAGAAFDQVKIKYINKNCLKDHIPTDYKLVALETCSGSKNLFKERLPDKMALLLGNEKYGIDQHLIELCDKAVHIPMSGPIKSMNVTHAASVCLFHWYFQFSNQLLLPSK